MTNKTQGTNGRRAMVGFPQRERSFRNARAIVDMYAMARGVGHTTCAVQGAHLARNGGIVLVHDEAMRDQMNRYAKREHKNVKFFTPAANLAGYRKPILLDNGLVWQMLTDLLEEIDLLRARMQK
jgi:hypothetical protein